MADECRVYEFTELRARGQVRPFPPLAYNRLSSGDPLVLNKSTNIITIVSSIDGEVDFQSTSGTAPDGTLSPFPITADRDYDFGVRPGTTIRFST